MKNRAIRSLKVTYDCIPCAIGSLITLFRKGLVSKEKQEQTMRALLKYFSKIDYNQSSPLLGREMHRIIRDVLQNPDRIIILQVKSLFFWQEN